MSNNSDQLVWDRIQDEKATLASEWVEVDRNRMDEFIDYLYLFQKEKLGELLCDFVDSNYNNMSERFSKMAYEQLTEEEG